MKRGFPLLLLCLIATISSAQVQQGYVKTLGRPDSRGVALSGVSVRVKGEHNPVLSRDDGTFSMLLTGKKNGDAYSLQEVRKKGYELNDANVVGRQYAYSDKVPLTIVMVSSAQLQADKQRIENNAFNVAEKNYKTKLALLEKQKAESAITEEAYRKELRDLQDKFEKYQSLIDDLSDHYAHVDYDELDEKEREINLCIEKGNLERADSLIHALFDPVDVLKRNKDALSQLDTQIAEANTIIDKANADMAVVLKQQEKDAEYLYHLYTIALSRFDNEKARFYIETRAALDSLNDTWQSEAGWFVHNYINDMSATERYHLQTLNACKTNYGDESVYVSWAYVNLGVLYLQTGNINLAFRDLEIALALAKKNNDDPIFEAAAQLGMALYLWKKKKTEDAYETTQKAYSLAIKSGNKQAPDIKAGCFSLLSLTSSSLGHTDEAISLARENLDNTRARVGDNSPEMVTALINMGNILQADKRYEEALKYYEQALDIEKKIFPAYHSTLATTHNNLGLLLKDLGQNKEAMEHLKTAIDIDQHVYGDNHLSIASKLTNIGVLYHAMKQPKKARECFDKSIEILTVFYGNQHPDIADVFHNIGELYVGNGKKVVEYEQKALDIYIKIYGHKHVTVARSLMNIANAYFLDKNYAQAKTYYLQAIDAQSGESSHSITAMCYEALAASGYLTGNISDLENTPVYYLKAAEYHKKAPGKNEAKIAECFENAATAYAHLGNTDLQKKYANQALLIKQSQTDIPQEDIGYSYYLKGHAAFKEGNYEDAATTLLEALKQYEKFSDMAFDDIRQVLEALDNTANKLGKAKKHEQELTIRKAIYEHWQQAGDKYIKEQAIALTNLGDAYRTTEQPDVSIITLMQALTMFENHSAKDEETVVYNTFALFSLSMAYFDKKDFNTCVTYLRKTMAMAEKAEGVVKELAETANQLLIAVEPLTKKQSNK